MPTIRNPFARRVAPAPAIADEASSRPASRAESTRGFERVETVGSLRSTGSRKSQDTSEYQMSVVNDSGVWTPPPAHEKKAWPRRFLSSHASSGAQSSAAEIEPFPISRESFDSYRRSFDITARSLVSLHDPPSRQSLDSALFARQPRKSLADPEPPVEESVETFEDVGLDDQKTPAPPRRRFFFRSVNSPQEEEEEEEHQPSSPSLLTAPVTAVSRFLLPGRKQRQSQPSQELGAELGPVARTPSTLPQAQEVH